jgi:16S rRNA (cytidine1402-2'-O)-methyltransferase
MGVLYLVGTPIGNLEDVTFRALRVLGEVGLIVAEDTRTTAKLLRRYGIRTPMRSFFEHNELVRQEEVLRALEVQDVALVSEAGMPTISDPGYRLVTAAIAASIQVIPIPGPSAVLTALSVSGLATDSFVFLGFLPRRRAARQQLLATLREEMRTLVCFEAPHRLLAALEDIAQVLGDRHVAVACELTKMFEQVWRGAAVEALGHWSQVQLRGEFTLVIAGAEEGYSFAWNEAQVKQALAAMVAAGHSRRDAVAQVALRAAWSKNDVYELMLHQQPDVKADGGKDD